MDLVSFDDTYESNDTLGYYDVDDVTIKFATNGCLLTFWGRDTPKGDYQEFKMVFPSLGVALDLVKDIESCRATK
jgi:hypothetical protein